MATPAPRGAGVALSVRSLPSQHNLLLVVHTYRDEDEAGQPVEIIHIISAREADRKERRRYEQETRSG